MRISMSTAEKVAKEMTITMTEQIKFFKNKRELMIQEIAKESVPKEIADIVSKYPKYLNYCGNVCLFNGSMQRDFSLKRSIPYSNWKKMIEVKIEVINEIDEIAAQISTVRKLREKTRKEIEGTLLGLRTFAKVKASFPKAYEFLAKYAPEKENEALMVKSEVIMESILSYGESGESSVIAEAKLKFCKECLSANECKGYPNACKKFNDFVDVKLQESEKESM